MLQITGQNIDKKQVKVLEKVLKKALKFLNQPYKKLSVDLSFVKAKEMQALNKKTRNIDKNTDVLSFPNLPLKAGETIKAENFKTDFDAYKKTLWLGDIVINMQKVESQAKEYNHSVTRELCYLFIHGILHLLGYDHMQEDDKKEMRKQEEQILNALKITR